MHSGAVWSTGMAVAPLQLQATTPHRATAQLRVVVLFVVAAAAVEHAACIPTDYGPLNVRTFGAKGDGVTDDSKAIQRTIDQAPQVSSLGSSIGPIPM